MFSQSLFWICRVNQVKLVLTFQFHISRSSWTTRDILCRSWKTKVQQQPSPFQVVEGSAEPSGAVIHTYSCGYVGPTCSPGTTAWSIATSAPARSSSFSATLGHQFLQHVTFIIEKRDCERPVQILAVFHGFQFTLTLLHFTSIFLL